MNKVFVKTLILKQNRKGKMLRANSSIFEEIHYYRLLLKYNENKKLWISTVAAQNYQP